ncbi:MAG TPA: outer membrane beta-barrel protein, partial [Gemmatimonadales bacterium]|nr:outer membrane beta-barrel protein [Gemmatimonadales bacterium]
MKRLSHLLTGALAVAGAAGPLAAQSGSRFELGGFGTYTRYDDALLLDDRIGGGGRLAWHLNRFLGLEIEGVYLGPSTVAGNASNGLHVGSASLMLGGGTRAFSLYALGGFTRLDMGTTAPYNYAENGFHGGAGFRIGLGDRLALRFDGRALIMPDDDLLGGSATHLLGSVGISYFTKPWERRAPPVEE